MVCTLRSQRMAALERLVTNSQTIADDFGHQKLAAEYIYRELREADEANLIDEKDMHVFDLRPMTDPLHLVCCNACRKPIKASQYAIHAELCSSLTCTEEISLELEGGTVLKKPPRKGKKKFLAVNSNQITTKGDRDKIEILDASDVSAPESHLEASPDEAKYGPAVCDGLGIDPRNTNCLGKAASRPRKRSKMSKVDAPPSILDHFEAASVVIAKEPLPCREHPRRSTTGNGKNSNQVVTHQIPRQPHEFYILNKDVPAPVATKVYYSQRNRRLRSALSHLYYNTSIKEHSSQFVSGKVFQPNADQTLTPSPNSFSSDQVIEHLQDKDIENSLHSVHKPDQILAQSSALYPCRSGGCPPTTNTPNQFPVNYVIGPHTSLGKMTSNYFSNSYSFADSSGIQLLNIQIDSTIHALAVGARSSVGGCHLVLLFNEKSSSSSYGAKT
ncbi:hypothetical protein ACH5RR_031172 [Cinchona calisaya]|uniref:SAGA-associated factor 11 n=1 Tax=Cinchona calisaya TaxID=153742 RepID=A0ABD2YEI9_9GENT